MINEKIEFKITDKRLKELVEFSEKYSVAYYVRFVKKLNTLRNIQPDKYEMIISTDKYTNTTSSRTLIDLTQDIDLDLKDTIQELFKHMTAIAQKRKYRKEKIKQISFEEVFKYLYGTKITDIEMGFRVPDIPPNLRRSYNIKTKKSQQGKFTNEEKSKYKEILSRQNILLKRENTYLLNLVRQLKKHIFDMTYREGDPRKKRKPKIEYFRKKNKKLGRPKQKKSLFFE